MATEEEENFIEIIQAPENKGKWGSIKSDEQVEQRNLLDIDRGTWTIYIYKENISFLTSSLILVILS